MYYYTLWFAFCKIYGQLVIFSFKTDDILIIKSSTYYYYLLNIIMYKPHE